MRLSCYSVVRLCDTYFQFDKNTKQLTTSKMATQHNIWNELASKARISNSVSTVVRVTSSSHINTYNVKFYVHKMSSAWIFLFKHNTTHAYEITHLFGRRQLDDAKTSLRCATPYKPRFNIADKRHCRRRLLHIFIEVPMCNANVCGRNRMESLLWYFGYYICVCVE